MNNNRRRTKLDHFLDSKQFVALLAVLSLTSVGVLTPLVVQSTKLPTIEKSFDTGKITIRDVHGNVLTNVDADKVRAHFVWTK